jgi:hypothetical protein
VVPVPGAQKRVDGIPRGLNVIVGAENFDWKKQLSGLAQVLFSLISPHKK